MANEFYSLTSAGIECWDVFTKSNKFVGLIVAKKDGTFRHFYNTDGTRGSSRKFASISEALANIDKRRAFIRAKTAA